MVEAGVVTLGAGEDRATVDAAAGGRLSSLVAGGAERLLGAAPAGDALGPLLWGCYVMAPWAGRLAGAALTFDGRRVEFPPNLGRHALHGTVFDKEWTVEEAAADTAVLSRPLDPWPFGGTVRQTLRLAPGRLDLAVEVTAADAAMPAAVGWHPWFRRPEPDGRGGGPAGPGDLAVRVDADEVLVTDHELIPTGARTPVRGDTDLRAGPPLGNRLLDHVYVAPRGPAVVTWPDLALSMSLPERAAAVVVHTPERGVCVEPQTAWPDAIRLASAGLPGTGLAVLAPGETLRAATTWRWRVTPSPGPGRHDLRFP